MVKYGVVYHARPSACLRQARLPARLRRLPPLSPQTPPGLLTNGCKILKASYKQALIGFICKHKYYSCHSRVIRQTRMQKKVELSIN